MRIFLDDLRDPPLFDKLTGDLAQWDHVCRTAKEAIALVETGKVTFISFDHDLGDGMDGIAVANCIERLAVTDKIPPIDYDLHSGNVVGAGNIDRAMKAAWHYWRQHRNIP